MHTYIVEIENGVYLQEIQAQDECLFVSTNNKLKASMYTIESPSLLPELANALRNTFPSAILLLNTCHFIEVKVEVFKKVGFVDGQRLSVGKLQGG